MPWQGTGAGTGSHIPRRVRRAVILRDQGLCQLGYEGCTGFYQELDHVVGVAVRGVERTHTLTVEELQCVCRACHKRKTAWQAKAGRGLGEREPQRDHRLGRVALPTGFRYAPELHEHPQGTDPLPR
ncbi:hypothetical protein D7316_01409 [Gordonia insulae]|uniref:HNH nuclease domain-containing protein n=2 Tax=Gordonia insulae TaxID=2420509 RepID=A0A3G8JIQ0_9ACTN|nr:hypothetical protein D7316_01409 [Gordonia insulae]